ncbi:MAG: hypothetical protein CSA07_01685 [Bacteroidia bacterium]|nr:MAG: hypothetical protein CSA07_01685 [Bacteroidia bacterium]
MPTTRVWRRAIVLLALLLAFSTLRAAPVGLERARAIAASHPALSRTRGESPALVYAVGHQATRGGGTSDTLADLYVFAHRGQPGFVMVAGDDRLPGVLAYSSEASFAAESIPVQLQDLLTGYSKLLTRQRTHKQSIPPAEPGVRWETVSPLLRNAQGRTIIWGQLEPFSNDAPFVQGADGEPVHAPSGCVATALGQIMYYHQWPKRARGEGAYSVSGVRKKTLTLGRRAYEWSRMRPYYEPRSYSRASADAVSYLMKELGAALHMHYTPTGSGSLGNKPLHAMVSHFGYSPATRLVSPASMPPLAFLYALHDELLAGRPIYVQGFNHAGGHAFVCDGVDDKGYFHLNWGWDGLANGYYLISALVPTMAGVGAQAMGSFGVEMSVLLGLEPAKGEWASRETPRLSFETLEMEGGQYSHRNGELRVEMKGLSNQTLGKAKGEVALALTDETGAFIARVSRPLPLTIPAQNLLPRHSFSVQLRSLPSLGTYRLRPVFRFSEAEAWSVVGHLHHRVDWSLRVEKGRVMVSRAGSPPQLVVSIESPEALVKGRENPLRLRVVNAGDTPYASYLGMALTRRRTDPLPPVGRWVSASRSVSIDGHTAQTIETQLYVPKDLPSTAYLHLLFDEANGPSRLDTKAKDGIPRTPLTILPVELRPPGSKLSILPPLAGMPAITQGTKPMNFALRAHQARVRPGRGVVFVATVRASNATRRSAQMALGIFARKGANPLWVRTEAWAVDMRRRDHAAFTLGFAAPYRAGDYTLKLAPMRAGRPQWTRAMLSFPFSVGDFPWQPPSASAPEGIIEPGFDMPSPVPKATSVTAHPNPARDRLVVTSSASPIRALSLHGLDGRPHLRQVLPAPALRSQLALPPSLPRGLYILRLETDEGPRSLQILLE